MPPETILPAEPAPSWPSMAGELANALGGLLLGLEACVVVPGLLPAVAIGVVLALPIVAIGLVAAVVLGISVAAVRLVVRAARR
jgi:hypothetical protein